MEWLVLGQEDAPVSPDSYVISFAPLHKCRLVVSPHPFFRGLLHHYQIELQHLNPNGIQHITTFIAMCEGYLGIEPHFELWRYLFSISLIKERGQETSVPMGCAGIHLRGQRAAEYMPCQLSRSNKGWHSHWFYLKNDPAAPLPVFSGCLIEEVPPSWPWGPPIKKKKRMHDLLEAITFLKTHGLYGAIIIGGYHARRVAPLMACVLSLYGMMPNV